jgi:hypothetical protein
LGNRAEGLSHTTRSLPREWPVAVVLGYRDYGLPQGVAIRAHSPDQRAWPGPGTVVYGGLRSLDANHRSVREGGGKAMRVPEASFLDEPATTDA